MYLVLTFDVESNLGSKEILYDLPNTLNILSSFPEIKCTFNVASHALNINKKNIQNILDQGHEIAAHGYKHDMNWADKTLEEQELLIKKAKNQLESELNTEIVGWATPRGNMHSANIDLLRKYGFLYVRDKAYINYFQCIPLRYQNEEILNLPRFGYDESVFMKRNIIQKIYSLFEHKESKKFIFDLNKFSLDWDSSMIYLYLENLYNYKRYIENSYLVTNLHPFRIAENKELERAFVHFLEKIALDREVTSMTAKDFCREIKNKELVFKDESHKKYSTILDKKYLEIIPRELPNIALVYNKCDSCYEGDVEIGVNYSKYSFLSALKYINSNYGLICDWSKKSINYELDLLNNKIKLRLSLPPYSTTRIYIGRRSE